MGVDGVGDGSSVQQVPIQTVQYPQGAPITRAAQPTLSQDSSSSHTASASTTSQYAATGSQLSASRNSDPLQAFENLEQQDAQNEQHEIGSGFAPNAGDDQSFGFQSAALQSQLAQLEQEKQDPTKVDAANAKERELLSDFRGWVDEREQARQQQLQNHSGQTDTFTDGAQATLENAQREVAQNPNNQIAQAQVAIGKDRQDEVRAETTKGFKPDPKDEKLFGASIQPLLTDLNDPLSAAHDQDLQKIIKLTQDHQAKRGA